MSKIDINDLKENNIEITVTDITDGIKLTFSGKIDIQSPFRLLDPFFNNIHNKIIEAQIKVIEVDVRDIVFMNSSGIGTLLKWLMKVPKLEDHEKYQIIIINNKNIVWQVKSLQILETIGKGLIKILD